MTADDGAAGIRRRNADAYRRMCAAEDAAPGPRERMAAAIDYLTAVLANTPDAALRDGPAPNPAPPASVHADLFRSAVLTLAASLAVAAEFQVCDHSRAAWCAEPDCYAMRWIDPADPGRVVPLDHRHCPVCQGLQRGGQPWTL